MREYMAFPDTPESRSRTVPVRKLDVSSANNLHDVVMVQLVPAGDKLPWWGMVGSRPRRLLAAR
jgi:hypothetical protein